MRLSIRVFEVIIRPQYDTSEDSVNALGMSVMENEYSGQALTTSPNEYMSDGLLSSPLK
jgi:hypothetical protein